MEGAGDDLQLQLLAESDFRSVVTVQSDALENVPEITSELHVSLLGHGVAVTRAAIAPSGHRGIVHGAAASSRSAMKRRIAAARRLCHGFFLSGRAAWQGADQDADERRPYAG